MLDTDSGRMATEVPVNTCWITGDRTMFRSRENIAENVNKGKVGLGCKIDVKKSTLEMLIHTGENCCRL